MTIESSQGGSLVGATVYGSAIRGDRHYPAVGVVIAVGDDGAFTVSWDIGYPVTYAKNDDWDLDNLPV